MQDLLAVGVGKGRPALADAAGAHPQGVCRQHHVFRSHRAVLRGKQEALGPKQGDDRGRIVEGVCQVGVVGNTGLLPGYIVFSGGHAGAGVGPLDFAQALVDLLVLADHKQRALPASGAGGVQPGPQDFLQGFFCNLAGRKAPDGPAVQDGIHQFSHGQTTSFQHWGSAA